MGYLVVVIVGLLFVLPVVSSGEPTAGNIALAVVGFLISMLFISAFSGSSTPRYHNPFHGSIGVPPLRLKVCEEHNQVVTLHFYDPDHPPKCPICGKEYKPV